MSEQSHDKDLVRAGSGAISSPTEVKYTLGRGSAVRVQQNHQGGGVGRSTEFAASKNLERGSTNAPTKLEMRTLFDENSEDVRIYRAAGMNDQQIYNVLFRKH